MRQWSGFVATVALALLLLSGSEGWGKSGGLRLKKVEIVDAQGFERPMTALTLLIPMEWQARGGVRWNAAAMCQTDGTRLEWTATGPGGFQAKGIADRAAMTSKANAEISQIIRDGEEYRQSVVDKSHEKWSRVIREVEVYDDPLEGRIELPNTYEHAWRLDDGSYWMSDDANFDPYRDLGLNGTELDRAE